MLVEDGYVQSIYAYLEQELGMQIVTSNTFNSDGIMFEYTQSRHHPEHFSFHDTASRKNKQ